MMSILYSALRDKILRMLDDPTGASTSDDLVKDAVHAGLDAIMPWCPNRSMVTIPSTSGSSAGTDFMLPDDLYRIEGVYSDEGVPIKPARLDPEVYRGVSQQANDWIEYPSGHLLFSEELDHDIVVYYLAYWPKPTVNSSIVGVPSHLFTAICLYASAYCLIPGGVSSASIRQFAQRVDSGTPEDNPLATRVEKLLKLFEMEMNRHPAYMRATRI
jgi:hypothetical protein